MSEWSGWKRVGEILDAGWEITIPGKVGIYRFRVRPDHQTRAEEVVYVGRGGFEVSKGTSTICSRVGTFIAAAMGFWASHSGGRAFREQRIAGKHDLNVRDLEVSFKLDGDSKCAEVEEYASRARSPAFNSQKPSTCGRASCDRGSKLRQLGFR